MFVGFERRGGGGGLAGSGWAAGSLLNQVGLAGLGDEGVCLTREKLGCC